jgi:hypothetical protein
MSESNADPTLPIYTLLCNRDVNRALRCLKSLHEFCRDSFRHSIIDDGSLTPDDRERLGEVLGPVSIISREEAEDRVGPMLQGKPNCQEYRKKHAFALKLIDTALLADGAFAHCDGDVLFLRAFQGFDRRLIGGEDFVFMKDFTTAYSIGYLDRHFRAAGLRLPQSVNAGFMYAGPGSFDLDFIEWFLGRPEYRVHAWVMEQTAWAALGGRRQLCYFADNQVVFPWKSSTYRDEWVALHFISPIRDRLDDVAFLDDLAHRASVDAPNVRMLRTRPAQFVGPLRDLGERLYRRLQPKV